MSRPRKNLPNKAGWHWFWNGDVKNGRKVWMAARILNTSVGLWYSALLEHGSRAGNLQDTRPDQWGNHIKCKPV